MSAVIRHSVTRLTTGERTCEVVTDGRVGAQSDATDTASRAFDGPAFLSFRASEWGELRFYFTDQMI